MTQLIHCRVFIFSLSNDGRKSPKYVGSWLYDCIHLCIELLLICWNKYKKESLTYTKYTFC